MSLQTQENIGKSIYFGWMDGEETWAFELPTLYYLESVRLWEYVHTYTHILYISVF